MRLEGIREHRMPFSIFSGNVLRVSVREDMESLRKTKDDIEKQRQNPILERRGVRVSFRKMDNEF